jgi:hypothetical protein
LGSKNIAIANQTVSQHILLTFSSVNFWLPETSYIADHFFQGGFA